MSQTQAAPQITGSMFLFEKPQLLTPQEHGDLGLQRPEKPFGFAAKARAIPLTAGEISTAARFYPIVFSSQTNILPLAVVGVFEDANLYVDENGRWETDVYVPAYVRRYPFAFATESNGERLALVIDVAYEGVAKGGEQPLFKDGQPSEVTTNAMEFCRQYESDRRGTAELMKRLEGLNLVVGQSAQFTKPGGGEPQTFAQYYGVDEQALNALGDEQFLEIRRAGLLPLIYMQLLSMGNWRHVLARRARRYNIEGDALLKPLNTN